MTDLIRTRLLAMVDAELKETEGSISNNQVWALAARSPEENYLFEENIEELIKLQNFLLKLREQIVEGELNV